MSTYGTVIESGAIAGNTDGLFLPMRQDVDWVRVINYTEANATNINHGFEYIWFRNMPTFEGIMYYHPAADHTMAVDVTATGFMLYDDSKFAAGPTYAITAGTNATRPVYSTANTSGLNTGYDGAVVRIWGTDQTELNGMDFSIDAITLNTEFRLKNTLATTPGIVAGANGFYKLVTPSIQRGRMFYPRQRVICNISQAVQAVVTMLVDHDFEIGEQVRITVPEANGMTELNGQLVTIVGITDGTITIDADTTAMTPFVFPNAAALAFAGGAQVVPVGENSGYATCLWRDDMIRNGAELGLFLFGGETGPAGTTGDTLYYIAGKSINL